jgi:hypothetical protein
MNIYEKIIKDCYWDYRITQEEIKAVAESDDLRLTMKLFSKIINHSTDRILALSVFSKDDVKYLLLNFKQHYNAEFIERRLLLLRNVLLGEHNFIRGAEWKKR